MPKNGHGISAVAIETDELYDTLSLDEQGFWDSIGASGYTPKQRSGLWFACKPDGADIGPAPTLNELAETVNAYVADQDAEVKIDDGETYLPGQEPAVKAKHKELAHSILAYDKAKYARVDATAKETETKTTMDALLKIHEADLLTDNDKGYKYYLVGKVRGILEGKTTYKTRTERMDGEEE